ncbi:E3 ubiquitin-protein ligase PPP1R11-like isoform X1 [Tribolium madens]|uniref:E3 ubiquitin-protein ligase PPP1R11-like isoform X1 n=1 Tax=Tribolium madens TaxID=41895 RepID=UPI001CF73C93|nr:E3 ubiquitin-protein ligase PPP1R11-like isoform X1 [Tribolium madens]
MTDPSPSQAMQEPTASTVTVVETVEPDEQDHEVPTLKLRLTKPKSDKKVDWTTETVDNEHMDKKKSKCCCIYKKPRNFDESSSEEESDDECEHCKGHVEKKKKKHPPQDDPSTFKSSDESLLNHNE